MYNLTIKERLGISGVVIFFAVIVCLATPLTTDMVIGVATGSLLYQAVDHVIYYLRKRA